MSLKNPPQDQTLIQLLRDDLRLTSTKMSCGEGACGACTVTLAKAGTNAMILKYFPRNYWRKKLGVFYSELC
jgi:aerobic-type carbon monoxide dehydrogenase small subunit (CoxS/CutS family)